MFKKYLLFFGSFFSVGAISTGGVILYDSFNLEKRSRIKLLKSWKKFKKCDLPNIKTKLSTSEGSEAIEEEDDDEMSVKVECTISNPSAASKKK